MSIFDHRTAYMPFEYPRFTPFVDAINDSFWTFREWNFSKDVIDFHTNLTDIEKSAIKNSLLAISQIEVDVKKFWALLGDRFPKAEIAEVGGTFAESEIRHARAYSELLSKLGLQEEFENVIHVPAISGRVEYLKKYLKGAASSSHENYTLILALFSIFIENISLFSQFAIIKAFNTKTGRLKTVDNVVQATMKEETIHHLFGVELINTIRSEFPEWFNDDFYQKIIRAAKKSYTAECNILDWIFEKGELDFLPKDTLKEFIKDRLNTSLERIGCSKVFDVDYNVVNTMKWLEIEDKSDTNIDFFVKKSADYTKNSQSFTADDLF